MPQRTHPWNKTSSGRGSLAQCRERGRVAQDGLWVDAGVVPSDSQLKVLASSSTRRSDEAEGLALLDILAGLDHDAIDEAERVRGEAEVNLPRRTLLMDALL